MVNLSATPKAPPVILVTIPSTEKSRRFLASELPTWDAEDLTIARAFGDRRSKSLETLVLRVPSVVTEGREYNVLIQPLHPQVELPQLLSPVPARRDQRTSFPRSYRAYLVRNGFHPVLPP
jgi:RES domain-containing protein